MSYHLYHWCIVPECKNTSIRTPGKLWIQLPTDLNMRNTWLKLARRDPNTLSIKTRLYLCEDHFDLENDMENYTQYKIMGSVKRIRMKPSCTPSRFDCQVDTKCKSTSKKPRHGFIKRQRMSTIKEIEETLENYVKSLSSCSQDFPMLQTNCDETVQVVPAQEHKSIQVHWMIHYQSKYVQSSIGNKDSMTSPFKATVPKYTATPPFEMLEKSTDTPLSPHSGLKPVQLSETKNTELNMDEIIVKQESESVLNENTVIVQIKAEVDDHEPTNVFQNIPLEVKEEIDSPNYYKSLPTNPTHSNIMVSLPNSSTNLEVDVDPKTETDVEFEKQTDNDDTMEVKKEMGEDSIVPYEYPDYEDSMDSNEAVALGNVEACLQDDPNLKTEHKVACGGPHKEDFNNLRIKEESELTVTETHLISNKFINTTSTITNPQDGLIQSLTTNTLVMEIHPMTSTSVPLTTIGNPSEILPTTYSNEYNQNMFQLNSITGNILSLEQEAYGLLKTKKKKNPVYKLYVCPKCPKICKSVYALKRHLGVHGTIERRIMGVMKGQQTRKDNQEKVLELTLQERLKMLKAVKNEKAEVKKEGYECTCGQAFRRRSRMETCLRSHNMYSDINSTHKCITCSKQFRDKVELAMHRRRFHRKKFPCKFCPTDYATRKELFKHLQVHQKVQLMEYKVISEVVKGKQKLRCFMCPKSYAEISELKFHVMEDHKEPYACPQCTSTFNKIIDIGNHIKTSHPEIEGQSVLDVLEAFSKLVKAWKCEECGLQFHEADKLALHQIEKHSPDLKADPQLQCPDCRRVFISQKGLTSHRRIHHSTESTEEAEPVEQGIMCVECRKICKDTTALTSHMRLHSLERKYPCKFCDFRFATPEKRKTHSEIHTGDLKYVCFICEYQCSSENRLKQHKMSLKHANIKEILLTGKPLLDEGESTSKKSKDSDKKSKGSQKKRKKEKERTVEEKDSENKGDNNSSESEVEVACDVCGDMFANEAVMLEHKQTHPFIEFPNDDKPTRIFFK